MSATCCWILLPAMNGNPPRYCGQKTSYTIEIDDDGNKYRKYRAFCDKHQIKVDQQRDADQEIEE